MRVIVHEPVVVAKGPTYNEVGWGPFQFPCVGVADDGRIMIGVHNTDDAAETFGADRLWFTSKDGGETFEPISAEAAAAAYTRTPNGDRLRCCEIPPQKDLESAVEGVKRAYEQPGHGDYYMFDDLNPGYIERKFKFYRVKAGETDRKIEYADIGYWPKFPVVRQKSGTGVMPPFLFGKLRVAPDGSLWHTHYMYGTDPVSGIPTNALTAYFFRSTDEGKTWDLVSWVDPNESEGAYVFCEVDIAWTNSGKAIALFRAKNIFYAISDDGGYTWNKPQRFIDDDSIEGVDPSITTLKCGGAVASFGRPHFYIRTSCDVENNKWDDVIDICPETCGYSDSVAISDNEAIIGAVDFQRPDENGVCRKTLLSIKVTFVED